MQYANADLPLAGPIGAGGAYGKVMRETESAREIERRVFEQITDELETAELSDAHFTVRIAALHRNRDLWLTLTCDLADEDNALPAPLRAHIISLGIWVLSETRRLMRDGGPHADLIEVNRSIMRGLNTALFGAG